MEVGIILSIVVAGSTVIYTIINYLTLRENIRQRKQKISPNIIAYLKSTEDHEILSLHLKNIGEGVGNNIEIQVLKSYDQFSDINHPITNLGVFKNGLNIFPPGYEMRFYIDSMKDIDYGSKDSSIELIVSWERLDGKKTSNYFRLPFNQLTGQNYSNPPENYMGQIPYYLKEINSSIKKNINTHGA